MIAMSITNTFVARMKSLKEEAPEGTQLVVTMLTPNGQVMEVNGLRDEGYNLFSVDGYVDGERCVVVAHVFTLSFSCSFKSTKGESRVHGFMAALPERAS